MPEYMREIDLNPPAATGGPVTNPQTDPRSMHYFGFLSEGQEISIVQPFGGNPRVLISWHYGNQPTGAPLLPPPPIDDVLDFSGGPPVRRYDQHHERAHVFVWLDPAAPPPAGPAVVRVRAWSTKQP